MNCQKCGSEKVIKNGHRGSKQKYICKDCGYACERDINGSEKITPEALKQNETTNFLTEEQVRQKYDYNFIIGNALDAFQPGQFQDKEALLKRCGIRFNNEVNVLLKSEKFRKYRGATKTGQILFGHPERIKALINDTVLYEI